MFVGVIVGSIVRGVMVGESGGRAGQNTGQALDTSVLCFVCARMMGGNNEFRSVP